MKKQNTITILLALAFLAVAPLASAQIISLKWYSNASDIIGGAETAGAVSAVGWNNQDVNVSLTGTNLKDNSGFVTTLDYVLAPNGGGTNTAGGSTANGTTKLFASGRDGSNNGSFPTTLNITQIPFATYNLYVYVNAFFADRKDSFTVGGTTYYFQSNTVTTNYTQATSTTPGVYTSANYVKFSNLTSPSLTFTGVTLNGNSTVYEGFQVEAVVPEPSTWAMIGVGLLALLGMRRFRKLA